MAAVDDTMGSRQLIQLPPWLRSGVDVPAFHRSVDVMLVIGGVGYLYGGLIGASVFKILQDFLESITP